MKNQIKAVVLAVSMLAMGQASADTWNLAGSAPSAIVTVSAYANTGTGLGDDTPTSTLRNGATQTINTATKSALSTGYVGISNADACTTSSTACVNNDFSEGTTPLEHAIDNDQRYDMALLSFTSSVILSKVNLSWVSQDSDLTVLAFTGGAFDVNTNLKNFTYDQLTSKGWTVLGGGNYAGNGDDTAVNKGRTINTEGVASSFWLIGAFNPLVSSSTASMSGGFDYVKLASVVGTTCPPGSTGGTGGCGSNNAPEPGSLALMGVGLLGLLRLRKRR